MRLQSTFAFNLDVKYLQTGAQQGLKLGVDEAAGIFEAEAKNLVPVDTGNLQSHIHTEVLTDAPTTQERVVSPVVPASAADGDWHGFEPPYARRIEFGFIGQDSMGRNYHQPAQPYMRPAFDTKQAEAKQAIKDNVYSELDAAMAKVSQRRSAGRGKGQG